MARTRTYNKRNILIVACIVILVATGLMLRLGYLMIFKSEDYAARAQALHERERAIKAERGRIFDANGKLIATNKPVCTISVISCPDQRTREGYPGTDGAAWTE